MKITPTPILNVTETTRITHRPDYRTRGVYGYRTFSAYVMVRRGFRLVRVVMARNVQDEYA